MHAIATLMLLAAQDGPSLLQAAQDPVARVEWQQRPEARLISLLSVTIGAVSATSALLWGGLSVVYWADPRSPELMAPLLTAATFFAVAAGAFLLWCGIATL